MGEAPRGPSVPKQKGRGVAAVVGTSKHEPDKFERPKHRRTSSLPSTMPSASASDSDEEGPHSDGETQNSVMTLTTVTTLTGADSTSEGSSDEDDGKVSHANIKASTVGAPASFPGGKTSFTGGRGPNSMPSMTNHHGSSLRNSKFHEQQRSPLKKKLTPQGLQKTARFGTGERHTEYEGKRNKNAHSTSWSRKSLHRAKIAKEYSTSESEDEVPDAKPVNSSQHHLEPMKSNSSNKSRTEVVRDSKKLPGHTSSHGWEEDDGNSSTDSESSITTSYDSDDEEENDDKHGAKRRRRIHSRKPSLHQSPTPVKTLRVKITDEDGSIPASSGRDTYRSDVESHDADHEHELSEQDQDGNSDDDRRIRKMKRNEGNSASFSEAETRTFRWSTVKTKIYYSFRARGNDSDDEGSKVISVRNLALAVDEQILQEFFRGCGAVTSVNISRDEFGRCSGSAYVEFDSGAAARKARQKTGTKLLERVVFCDVARETTTSRHFESKTEPPPAPTPAATGGGMPFLRAFHRADNSEDSARIRHKKSQSSESLHFPRGLISPTDTITGSAGNEQSVHDSNAKGESIRGGSKKKLFAFSRSSGSGSHSLKLSGSQSQVQTPARELEQLKSQSRAIEVQSQSVEVQPRGFTQSQIVSQTRAIVLQSHDTVPDSSLIPEIVFQEYPNEGLASLSEGHKTKRKKWSFAKWRRKHRWVKISWLKWVKKPRWHWWHFANLSARWGETSRHPWAKTTPPPPLPTEAEPPEGYPRVFFSSSSKQSSPGRPVAAA